jgi:hypothetical protein
MSDDNPYGYRDADYPPPPRRVDGAGVALGVVAGIALTVADVSLIRYGAALAVLAGLLGFALAIGLVTRPSPFAKGLGVGLLVALSIALLLVGSCLAIIATSDFG